LYPSAYIEYLLHFHANRDYFECHEILEEHWKSDHKKPVWAGLIQIAVALYHHRRGNMKGAKRMMEKAIRLLETERLSLHQLGLDDAKLLPLLRGYLARIEQGRPYESIHLPIADEALLQTCLKLCGEKGLVWGSESDLRNEFLLHKHARRDRSDVIAAREQSKQKKRLPHD
jgi:predicted metal-dependent hydrolase